MDKREAENIANKFIAVVSKKYPVKKAWLFGSYANGSNRLDSDIDITILVNGSYEHNRFTNRFNENEATNRSKN